MNLYAETNFILELALQRSERGECATLLELARGGRIRLLLPGYSVGEPYDAWVRRTRQRIDLSRRIKTEIGELGRSEAYAGSPEEFADIVKLLETSSREEKEQIDSVIGEVLDQADLIALTAEVFRAAKAAEAELSLTPQDAIVFASVVADLELAPAGEKCFVTANAHDFNKPAIRERLGRHGCKLVTRFTDAVGFVRSRQGH